jgi:hypothetical protein
MAPLFEIAFDECATDTTIAVHSYNSSGAAAAAGFFIDIN